MVLRVAELFVGVGSQRMALRNIGVDFEVVATSDWEINTTLSYDAIHNKEKTDFSKDKTIKEIEDYLHKINISSDGKKPLTLDQIRRWGEKKKRDVYNAFRRSNNFGSIVGINPDELPDFDLCTYSFPCTDCSNAGKRRGLAKGSGTSSSMLWECQKIIEAKKPKYLLMENVKNLVSKRFISYFQEWLSYLEEQGYKSYWQVLNWAC